MKKEKIDTIRHTASHILALAVRNLYPDVKFAIGPAIENGFYYDFDFSKPISETDLVNIEKESQNIIKKDLPITHKKISKEEALKLFVDQPYKIELINDIDDSEVGIYQIGDFVDLCAGPHVEKTSEVNTFKLLSLAGAYWKGSEKNKMLTRIYGTSFDTQKELDEYLNNLEEAKKRDHRKLGKELDLFVFSSLVGPGLPLFTPKGTIIKEELQKRVEAICREYGFQKVSTPHLAKIDLYETSGHAAKFGDELFHVSSQNSDQHFVLKPVQCPHQTQIYASRPRSYRDLPIRYMESEKQYRAEKTGEVGGLTRVFSITVEDGHSFCRVDQVKEEIMNMVKIIKNFYSELGMWGSHWVSLSVRDYSHPEKYIGEEKDWDLCEQMLQEISDEMNLNAQRREGEAALYGPKLDFMFKDASGREIQIPTVQVDFATPKRFNLTYVNEKGEQASPVMVHRAILGSYERFMALLIEYFAGAFPMWLSPVQIKILPISDKFIDYSKEVYTKLLKEGFRVELDDRSETLGSRIRDAELTKVPFTIIIGAKETESGAVSVRSREKGDLGSMTLDDFLKMSRS